MTAIITDINQITPDWLTAILKREGTLERGNVVDLTCQTEERSAATIAHLKIRYDADTPPGAPHQLFLKIGGRRNEVIFHTKIAPEMGDAPVLRSYDAAFDHQTQHLLLTDASVSHAAPPRLISPTQSDSERMLTALAQVHAFWWEHPHLSGSIGRIDRETDNWGFIKGRVETTFGGFVDFMGDRLTGQRRATLEKVIAGWPTPALHNRLKDQHAITLTHGDAHVQNFMLPRLGMGKVFIIDWADWRIQPGPADVAFMIALECYPERRARLEQSLVRYYHERLLENGVTGYDWAQCWLDYRTAVIGCVLMPLFWYSWSPPEYWWHPLEKILLAYEDLQCGDLL